MQTNLQETVKHLATALNVEDFVATLLVQRGINTFLTKHFSVQV
jgi:hypothetical protein